MPKLSIASTNNGAIVSPLAMYNIKTGSPFPFSTLQSFPPRIVPYLPDRNHITFDSERPLVIGYISPDFFTHSVSYFIESVLRSYNKKTFTVICYANVERSDRKTTKLQRYPDLWRNVFGMGTNEVCELIRADKALPL